LGLGGLQVGLTTLAVMAAAMGLGQDWRTALAIGLIMSLSSTAIVLQTLNEKGMMKVEGGQASFSVLLFQDIAVIPMLALIPLLAMSTAVPTAGPADPDALSLVAGLDGWQVAVVNLAAIAAVILGGHYLTQPIFRVIAATRLREIFTAFALLLVVGTAFLMTLVGLSPALGTFLAGVVLASSAFRHELESTIDPFKGLLLGLFFITVGAGINFVLLFDNAQLVIGLTIGLMAVKALILLGLAVMFRLHGSDRWLLTLSLAQAGEFGFVLLSFALQSNVLTDGLAELLLLVVALSMLLTPALFILFDRVLVPRMPHGETREADTIEEQGQVIIAGMGRFGQVINRVMRSNGFNTVVLDHSSDVVDTFNKFGVPTFYGDASRPELLDAAGLDDAELLVVAIDDPERSLAIVEYARRSRPDLHIIARARTRQDVYSLYQAGATDIVRETFDSALRAGRYGLMAGGMVETEARRRVRLFENKDREGIRRLAALYDPEKSFVDNQPYMELARKIEAEIEASMLGEKDADSDRETPEDLADPIEPQPNLKGN
ncbi:MAG: cation:proton antiporter, partial [Pseudomonadota bacterium]